jgi:hypothetical protein
MALMQVMFQVQEEVLGKVHKPNEENESAKKLVEMIGTMHRKNTNSLF